MNKNISNNIQSMQIGSSLSMPLFKVFGSSTEVLVYYFLVLLLLLGLYLLDFPRFYLGEVVLLIFSLLLKL